MRLAVKMLLGMIAVMTAQASFAGGDEANRELYCTSSTGVTVIVEKLGGKRTAWLKTAEAQEFSPTNISKMIYSRPSTGPLAIVYINEQMTLILPLDPNFKDQLKTTGVGTLELTGAGAGLDVRCE